MGEGRAEAGPIMNRPPVPRSGGTSPLSLLLLWEAAAGPGLLGVDLHPGPAARTLPRLLPRLSAHPPSLSFLVLSADPPPVPPTPTFIPLSPSPCV